MASIEIGILNAIQNIRFPFLDILMVFMTKLGNGGIIWIAIGIYLLMRREKKYKKMAFILLLSLIISAVLGLGILKPIIRRPRPFETFGFKDLLIKAPQDFSFPSGHTSSSFAAASAINSLDRKLGKYALVLAALIAFSRMYLYVHYPTDVVAGILLGLVSTKASQKIRRMLEEKIAKWK